VPTTRFAFSDRSMTRVVEPGDVEIWVASHAAMSSAIRSDEVTGGAIVSERTATVRHIPGATTPRAIVAITGRVHAVTFADARTVAAHVSAPVREMSAAV
jgi:beta-xylosidase